MISTKNIDLSRFSEYKKGEQRVKGEDKIRIILTFPTGEPNAKDAIDRAIESVPGGMALLAHFTQQATRHLEAGYRELRGEQVKAELHTHYAAIQAAYRAHRATGLKHRETVHALVADPSLPFHGRWAYADFNWCVRSAPAPARSPKLTAVPASGKGAR